MGKEKKAYSKKGKLVSAIASMALIAVPFMAVPAAASVETELPVIDMDKIQTIVIPQNGTKYIDLHALAPLYDTESIYITQDERGMDIAYGQIVRGMDDNDIYEIKGSASNIGRATFTVSGYKYESESESEGTYFSDAFEVVVMPNTGHADDYKFDISHVISMMQGFPEQYDESHKVKGLLSNVSPKIVLNDSPIDYENNNSAPIQRPGSTRFEGVIGETIPAWEIEESLTHYFDDREENPLGIIFIDRNNPNIRIDEFYGEGEDLEYELTPLAAGDFDLEVLVVDYHGGMTRGIIPFRIETPPQLNTNSVLAKHFSLDNVHDPILYLSPNAEIDLNEIFYDAENEDLKYEVVVDAFSSSGSPMQKTIELSSSSPTLSWESLAAYAPPYGGSIKKINEFRAYEKNNESLESVLAVNIVPMVEQDLFPAMQELYKSNAAGTSSYLFNYQGNRGFAENYTEISDIDIHNVANSAVTASVYENVYLKFDVNTNATSGNNKIRIYGHNRETESILYQDDFNFTLITPQDTRDPDYHHPAISLRTLYPDFFDGEYWTGPNHVRDIVTVLPETLNNESSWTFETSSYMTVRLQDAIPTGTQVVFRTDLSGGNRVFYVPYIKE